MPADVVSANMREITRKGGNHVTGPVVSGLSISLTISASGQSKSHLDCSHPPNSFIDSLWVNLLHV